MSEVDLSIVVCFYNMQREATRSLFALSRHYQQGIENLTYEVIAIDNASTSPLSMQQVASFGPEFRYRFHPTDSCSPVEAIHQAVCSARGRYVMVLVDGAHICTPRVLSTAMQSFAIDPNAFFATVAMHLGPANQSISINEGYSQAMEDTLLAQCNWKEDGYQLFTIAGSFADNSGGWFGCLWESNCFALSKQRYLESGGLDSRFVSPGGGLMNLDFFRRMVSDSQGEYFLALGEATFHQVHGGISTNANSRSHPWDHFMREYIQLRGVSLHRFVRQPTLIGSLPAQARAAASFSMQKSVQAWQDALLAAS